MDTFDAKNGPDYSKFQPKLLTEVYELRAQFSITHPRNLTAGRVSCFGRREGGGLREEEEGVEDEVRKKEGLLQKGLGWG